MHYFTVLKKFLIFWRSPYLPIYLAAVAGKTQKAQRKYMLGPSLALGRHLGNKMCFRQMCLPKAISQVYL